MSKHEPIKAQFTRGVLRDGVPVEIPEYSTEPGSQRVRLSKWREALRVRVTIGVDRGPVFPTIPLGPSVKL